MRSYESQSARDAQRMGYGDQSYWDYLDEAERANRDMWISKGNPERAAATMTRSISEALRGNDGE